MHQGTYVSNVMGTHLSLLATLQIEARAHGKEEGRDGRDYLDRHVRGSVAFETGK